MGGPASKRSLTAHPPVPPDERRAGRSSGRSECDTQPAHDVPVCPSPFRSRAATTEAAGRTARWRGAGARDAIRLPLRNVRRRSPSTSGTYRGFVRPRRRPSGWNASNQSSGLSSKNCRARPCADRSKGDRNDVGLPVAGASEPSQTRKGQDVSTLRLRELVNDHLRQSILTTVFRRAISLVHRVFPPSWGKCPQPSQRPMCEIAAVECLSTDTIGSVIALKPWSPPRIAGDLFHGGRHDR